MMKFRNIFARRPPQSAPKDSHSEMPTPILHEEQQEQLDQDLSILEETAGVHGERLQKEAEKEVRTAAVDSLKKLHVIQLGRCPKCGEHLHKHLFASVCESCGWHTFDTPRNGPVRVHLQDPGGTIEGERCYVVSGGTALVINRDVVTARIPPESLSWIEYLWDEEDLKLRHKQVVDRMTIRCGWCDQEADPEKEGFHMAHVAFASTQERYCFCSDECFEAFRKMFPARVHRNCYDRNCAECDLCIKRYSDEAEGLRMLAKDYLTIRRKR